MAEEITLQKFFSGILNVKTGVKALAFLPWLLLFLVIGFTIWRAYFKPLPTQHQNIIAQEGSHVTVIQKQEEKKKKWWIPSPFVEVYTFVQTDDRKGFGGRFGGRWEF